MEIPDRDRDGEGLGGWRLRSCKEVPEAGRKEKKERRKNSHPEKVSPVGSGAPTVHGKCCRLDSWANEHNQTCEGNAGCALSCIHGFSLLAAYEALG